MCTVTFIPSTDGIYLTSNRDEHYTRSTAIFPNKYASGDGEIIYPKDRDAGGSWVALKQSGDAAVLLNGAFDKHQRLLAYRKSRGLVFMDIIKSPRPDLYFEDLDLGGIEPFTLIVFVSGRLHECIWDGENKYVLQRDTSASYIWSSVTLYNRNARVKRQQWFDEWRESAKNVTSESILHFHRSAGNNDTENGLVMNRSDIMRTVSITSIKLSPAQNSMTYLDLSSMQERSETLSVNAKPDPTTQKPSLGTRKFFIRLFNREYWPHHLVYAPVYLYWIWLSLKARSFFFFNTANPSIKNGGFLMESKKKIYDIMPAELYPKTIYCKSDAAPVAVKALIAANNLSLPFIAKPDIGLQGLGVTMINSENDLAKYLRGNKVDFLLQEFVARKNEIGIFYYRIPGESQGRISGIVGKEFIKILGDGRSTIEQLLLSQDRYVLQFNSLKVSYGNYLQTVLPPGVEKTLAPFGNHRRGAKFTDQTGNVNQKLTQTVDALCKKVPGFFYGRLDIKFDDFDDLCEGKNFSIIEINGAGSEPTHIYDPRHTLFFVWKEVIRHWQILFTISRLNASREGIKYLSMRDGLKMFSDNRRQLKLLSE
jgi:Transport and Golgi organisation 2/RimK-like ATP-grasp domain